MLNSNSARIPCEEIAPPILRARKDLEVLLVSTNDASGSLILASDAMASESKGNAACETEPAVYLSPLAFSRLSGLSLATIRRYLKSGKLRFFQPGGKRARILIARSAVEQLAPMSQVLASISTVPLSPNIWRGFP